MYELKLTTDEYISVPRSLYGGFTEKLPPGSESKPVPGLGFTVLKEYATDCPPYDSFPVLEIHAVGKILSIRPNDYVLRSTRSSGCVVRVHSHQFDGRENIFDLGTPFFRSTNVLIANSNVPNGSISVCSKSWA
jgi:hypothetical protein